MNTFKILRGHNKRVYSSLSFQTPLSSQNFPKSTQFFSDTERYLSKSISKRFRFKSRGNENNIYSLNDLSDEHLTPSILKILFKIRRHYFSGLLFPFNCTRAIISILIALASAIKCMEIIALLLYNTTQCV